MLAKTKHHINEYLNSERVNKTKGTPIAGIKMVSMCKLSPAKNADEQIPMAMTAKKTFRANTYQPIQLNTHDRINKEENNAVFNIDSIFLSIRNKATRIKNVQKLVIGKSKFESCTFRFKEKSNSSETPMFFNFSITLGIN